MQFEAAWLWLFVPPLLVYLWWLAVRGYAQLSPAARRISLALRVILVLLLLAALSRPTWMRAARTQHVVLLLDASQSVSAANIDAGLAQIDSLARDALAAGDARVTVAVFGESARVLVRGVTRWNRLSEDDQESIAYARTLPTLYAERTRLITSTNGDPAREREQVQARIERAERFREAVAGNYTDIERAVRLALGTGGGDERRTIYLLTDGNFNRGRFAAALSAAESAAARVHTVVLDRPSPPEVSAVDVQLPGSVRVDQGFTADIRLASTLETDAELRIFKDGYQQQELKIHLKPGTNTVRVPNLSFHEKGFHAVEAVVKAPQDTQLVNNRVRALVIVPGPARVLYVDRDIEQIPYLKGALELEGMQVEARSSAGVPQSLSELLSFDALILCNVPADRLTAQQMQMIRTYVQDFGGGFLMLGGDESFGLGGYYNTPIEEILPVRMPIQKDLLRPSLALFLVIDKSGSMEGAKIQLAKRAAMATAETINTRDLIGVIGFDSEARTLLELTPAGDKGTIESSIAQLDAAGGTFLYPALTEAHEKLNSSNARRKHIIVLSDGQTQGFGYDELVGSMGLDGISLSAVGIGEGADMNLMESIAGAGAGRAYFTNDFSTIPQIFTREALRASRSMLVERLVQPSVVGDDPALAEIASDQLPLLTGYVATTPRPTAQMLIVSDTGDPILAKWRFGLGRTAAFTSEPKPRWAEDWIEWDDFAKFWSQLVRSVTSERASQGRQIEAGHRVDGDDVVLTADIRDPLGGFVDNVSVELTGIAADGKSTSFPVSMQGPGLFETRYPRFRFGQDHQLVWRVREAAGNSAPATQTATAEASAAADDEQIAAYGFVYSYSPEFATLGASPAVLEEVKHRHLGTGFAVGSAKLDPSHADVFRQVTLWPYLLAAALLLIPLDILVRRLDLRASARPDIASRSGFTVS